MPMPFNFFNPFKFVVFASSAGGLRNCNAAAFASLKKICYAFFSIPAALAPNQKRRLMQLLV